MYAAEIEIRTAMVEIHREHALALLKKSKEILKKRDEVLECTEKDALWELFRGVITEVEIQKKKMASLTLGNPDIKVVPLPHVSELP